MDIDSAQPKPFSQNLQQIDIQQLIAAAETLFIDAGKAKARATALDEKRKRVRSSLFVHYRNLGKSAADSEHFAAADPRYQSALDDSESASMHAEVQKAKAEATRMQFEAWRTVEASTRAAMVLR